jgi:glyoxylase-like metal-dependent hydrolase (beta-lactamase superfamily II)
MRNVDRRSFVVTAAAGVLVLPGVSNAAQARPTRATSKPVLPWIQVRPQVWVTAGMVPGGNVLVATDDGGAMVIDSKFASVAGAMVRDARAHAGTPDARLTLVNSHHHGDHTSGNAAFSRAGAVMVAQAQALPRIEGQMDRYRASAASAVDDARGIDAENLELLAEAKAQVQHADSIGYNDVVPRVSVTEGGSVQIGPSVRAVLSYYGAGHTDNDLVVQLPDANVVHTGDLVFNGRHPFCDPTGGISIRGWVESLVEVEKLCDDQTVVVPGHGPVGDVRAVRAQREYFEQLIEAVREAQKAGRGKDQTVSQTFPFMDGLGADQVRGRAISAAWDEVEKESR